MGGVFLEHVAQGTEVLASRLGASAMPRGVKPAGMTTGGLAFVKLGVGPSKHPWRQGCLEGPTPSLTKARPPVVMPAGFTPLGMAEAPRRLASTSVPCATCSRKTPPTLPPGSDSNP